MNICEIRDVADALPVFRMEYVFLLKKRTHHEQDKNMYNVYLLIYDFIIFWEM